MIFNNDERYNILLKVLKTDKPNLYDLKRAKNVYKDYNIPKCVGEYLEKIFFKYSKDYVLGIHSSHGMFGDSINLGGLHLSGHLSSIATCRGDKDTLDYNIIFYKNITMTSYINFIYNVTSASVYKSPFLEIGDAVIVAIPKSDLEFDERGAFHFKSTSDPTYNKGRMNILKPSYILGYFRVNKNAIDSFSFNPAFSNLEVIEDLLNLRGIPLTGEEVDKKMSEYNSLLDSDPLLHEKIINASNGSVEMFYSDEEYYPTYLKLKELEFEILTEKSYINNTYEANETRKF